MERNLQEMQGWRTARQAARVGKHETAREHREQHGEMPSIEEQLKTGF
jgi:hypothetical protein